MQDMQATLNLLIVSEYRWYVIKKRIARHARKLRHCMSCNNV